METKKKKKLTLNKDTLRDLTSQEIDAANGGAGAPNSALCPPLPRPVPPPVPISIDFPKIQ